MFHSLEKKWSREKEQRITRSKGTRDRLIRLGQNIFKEFNIEKVILFGSVLENRMSVLSDIDILVTPLPADQFFNFQCQLENTLDLTVDLHTMDEDNEFIEKIIKRGEVIYEI
jgi:predicted nucleotidyltransferase